ncbi:hypothetical protein ACF05R_30575 [Streptomyces albidoflavus]
MKTPISTRSVTPGKIGLFRGARLFAPGSAIAVALILLFGGTAHANTDEDNIFSSEACQEWPGSSKFKFTIYYNSGMNGAWRNIGYSVYDFNSLKPGGSSTNVYKLKFCGGGVSTPPPGAAANIKNNAASAENYHYKYWARVYYNSGYKGAQDVMAPYQHIARFRNVYNENASFRWTSS